MKLLPGMRNVIYPFLLGELDLDLCLRMHVLLDGKQNNIQTMLNGFFLWGWGIEMMKECRLICLLGGGNSCMLLTKTAPTETGLLMLF